MSKIKIFCSYGHDEYSSIVLKIKQYLEEKDYQVFFDVEQLHLNDDWAYKLEQGIKECNKVIFFITPHSARRPDGYCLNEIAMALYYKKDILPIMMKFEIPPLSIVRKQYLDMQELTLDDDIAIPKFEEKMKHLLDVLENKVLLDFEGSQAKSYKELSPIDFTQDFAKHKKFIGRGWLKNKIDLWIEENSTSRVLWIIAEAGYGKSAVSANLVNTNPDIIGLHFCGFNYPNKKSPISIIKTIAYHLLSQIPEYANEIRSIDILKSEKSVYELFEVLILNPLSRLENVSKKYIFVIDALDEAVIDGQNPLANLIRDEFSKLPLNIKIIITSRPDSKLKQVLSQFNPLVLKADNEQNVADCKLYISDFLKENKYEKLIDNKKWIETLLYKSEANMLYLTRFFDEVKIGNLNIEEPEKIPYSLNGLYAEFFNRIIKNEDDYYANYASIFEVLVAFDKVISREMLSKILDIDKISLKRKLNKFGTLLREEDSSISFYHKSLSDWLLMYDNTSYQINIEEGYKKVYEYTKDLNLRTISNELLTSFSKSVIIIKEENIRYQEYYSQLCLEIMEQDNSFGLFYFYSLWHHIGDKTRERLKAYYYLFTSNIEGDNNYRKLSNYIRINSEKSIPILTNYAYDFPQEEWDFRKREALRDMFNPLALALIIDDTRIYKYIKNNSIVMKEISLWHYIEDILPGTSTQYFAYEIRKALKEKFQNLD